MDPDGPNILWALMPGPETDTAYHRGADISMISQFPAEQEGEDESGGGSPHALITSRAFALCGPRRHG